MSAWPPPPHGCPAEDVDPRRPLTRDASSHGDRAGPRGEGHAGRTGATGGRYTLAPRGLCSSSHQAIEGRAAGVTGTAPCEPASSVPGGCLLRAAADGTARGQGWGEQERSGAILEASQQV